jgi:arsenate reductase
MYGLSTCDTIRKARAWLNDQGIRYDFHDFKKSGCDPARIALWCEAVGWERLLNRNGATFRALPESVRAGVSRERALELMRLQPSMIRRPVLETQRGVFVGFSAPVYQEIFAAQGP